MPPIGRNRVQRPPGKAPGMAWSRGKFVPRNPPRMGQPPRTGPPPQADIAQALLGGQRQPEMGTLTNPFTDTMAAPAPAPAQPPQQQGPQLARPVSNAGNNGSNARYFIGPGSGLTRGDRDGDGNTDDWTDGVYWYDDNGLSRDRPDAFVQGLGPANESERYDPWSGRGAVPMQAAASSPGLGGSDRSQPYGMDFAKALMGGRRTQPEGLEGSESLTGAGPEQESLMQLLQALIQQDSELADFAPPQPQRGWMGNSRDVDPNHPGVQQWINGELIRTDVPRSNWRPKVDQGQRGRNKRRRSRGGSSSNRAA